MGSMQLTYGANVAKLDEVVIFNVQGSGEM